MAVEDLVEIKLRLANGSDIGPSKFIPSTTVGSLKEKIIALWPKDDVAENTVETSVQKDATSAGATSSGTKQHRKRNCNNEDLEKMTEKLGEVAAALTKISANKLDINQLHDEIIKIEGYSEKFLDSVFDHLVQNEKLGKAFICEESKTSIDFSREVQERLAR